MATTKTRTKKSSQLTLRDRLSRLTFQQASQLLGNESGKLIAQGCRYEFEELDKAVYLQGDLFRLSFPDGRVVVTINTRADPLARPPANMSEQRSR